MKRIIILGCCLCIYSVITGQVIFSEDFSGELNGSISGTATGGTWSSTYGGAGTFSKQSVTIPFLGTLNYFEGSDLETEGVWSTNAVAVASGYATVEILGATLGTEAGDYLRAYYKVNGGPEILFYDLGTSGGALSTGGSAIVNAGAGGTIQIVVRVLNNAGDIYSFDNPSITQITTLYSRTSTNWTTSGTWSTVALGGANCSCTPTTFGNNIRVVIGDNDNVTLNVSATTSDLEVRNTGTLTWGGAVELNIVKRGYILVEAGGTITNAGNNGAQIDYDEPFAHAITIDGTFSMGDLEINGAATLDVDGTSSLSFSDDLIINGDAVLNLGSAGTFSIGDDIDVNDADLTLNGTQDISAASMVISGNGGIFSSGPVVVRNSTGIFNITNRIEFDNGASDGASFTNNQPLTAGGIFFDNDDCEVVNNSTMSITGDISANGTGDDGNTVTNSTGATLSFVNLDGDDSGTSGNGGDLRIDNAGTINQSGTFLDIPNNSNAANSIRNFDGATWNYGGTGHDQHIRLYANNGTNTFSYSRSGAQSIVTPVAGDGYSNINLQFSGAKTAQASFSVIGNWARTGTATFSPAGFTVTLNGATAQTISSVGGETFAGLTINNSFGSSPQVTLLSNVSISSTLTMTDGIVQSDASNLLIMLDGATTTTGSAGSYVSGPIQYNMAASNTTRTLNFPVGKSGNYGALALRVRHSAATSYSYTAEVISSSAAALGYTLAGTTDGVSGLRYWNIARGLTASPGVTNNNDLVTTGAASSPQLTINYVAADEVDQPSTLTVVKNVGGGTAWVDIGATATGSPAGSVTTTAPSTNFMSFSFFTLANLTGGTNPLPVELIDFSAKLDGDVVKLNWSTASELNNDFFAVERATDLEHFGEIENIPGSGTTKEVNHYEAIDPYPHYGRSYYRLRQTDLDGNFSYSDLEVVDYDGPRFTTIKAYPNPTSGDIVTVEIVGLKKQRSVPVQVFDVKGQKVYEKIWEVTTPGSIHQDIEFESPLRQGLYIMRAGKTLQLTERIIVD